MKQNKNLLSSTGICYISQRKFKKKTRRKVDYLFTQKDVTTIVKGMGCIINIRFLGSSLGIVKNYQQICHSHSYYIAVTSNMSGGINQLLKVTSFFFSSFFKRIPRHLHLPQRSIQAATILSEVVGRKNNVLAMK